MPRDARPGRIAVPASGCLALVIVLCPGMPCPSHAQWPHEMLADAPRPAPLFRAAWTSGQRTTERLVVAQHPDEPLQLVGKSLSGAGSSLRWLRNTRLVSL